MTTRLVARPAVLREIPLDRHAVIEASAGTGKTFTLEHLVVELVLAGDVSLDQVLIVTFTEKATGELRVRIRRKLEELLAGRAPEATPRERQAGDVWTLDAGARGRLEGALHTFDATTIATIHAFCQRVLRENAFASGRLFEERQVDGRQAFQRALRGTLRRELSCDPLRAPWLEAALRAGRSIEDLEELLWSCRQGRGELRPTFDPAELERAIAAFPVEDALQSSGTATLRAWGVHASTARKVATQLYELALAVERARSGGGGPALAGDGRVDLPYLLEKLGDHAGQAGPTGRACDGALALARATPSLDAGLAAIALPPVERALGGEKRAAGLYDFDDMLALVAEALRGPRADALAGALRQRWRYALIDEFQDTDETQWEIFRRGFFEASRQEASRVYLVGDPKQSIYRFRGADVQTYERARDEVLSAGGARVRLEDNFRASAALVQAQNALLDPDAPAPFFTGSIVHASVRCGRPERALRDGDGREVSAIHALRFEREIGAPRLGAWIAEQIRTITDPDRPFRLDGEPVGHHQIFVLTRTRSEGRAVGEALRAARVPFAFYKEDGLFQTEEARQVRALLAAIEAPADRALRAAAWMTAFFGLPLEQLDRARELLPTHPYVARLHEWRALADARDFERLLDRVLCDSGVVRREIFFGNGERELTNLLHILELLLEHARRTRCTLRELLLTLSSLVDGTSLPLDMEGNVQRLESERRAVQIMTIHKSKGLEASVVFLAGGWSQGRGDSVHVVHEGDRRVVWVGKAPAAMKARIQAEEREEEQRLMYVALTRARGRVYLPCVVREGAPLGLRGPYDVANRRVCELLAAGQQGVTVEDAPGGTVLGQAPDNDVIAAVWTPPAGLLRAGDDGAPYARLRARAAGTVLTSYTRMRSARIGAMSDWDDDAAARRADKGAQEVDAEPAGALRPARASGVFLHEVLERVPLSSFGEELPAWRARGDVASLFAEAMAIHRVEPAQREHAERLAWSAFTTPLPLPGGASLERLARARRVVREMEFVFPVAGTRTFVRGSIDVAFEHEGLTYFADWKTDSLRAYEGPALARHVDLHYRDQIRLYTLATVRLLGVQTRADYEARFGGVLYCFLRGLGAGGAGVWSSRPTWDEVGAWDAALGARPRGQVGP